MYQYPDYLIHYGVPGMKWGIRRRVTEYGTPKKNYRSSKRNAKRDKKVAKEYTRLLYFGDRINTKNVDKQFNKELESSKAYQNYQRSLKRRLETGEYTKKDYIAETKYAKRYDEIGKKYADKYLSASLKDLGFKDSSEGRKYISDLMAKGY